MDMVTITCYGKTETMTRSEAINFYVDGMMSCDGAEKNRYANIVGQLLLGWKECSDEK